MTPQPVVLAVSPVGVVGGAEVALLTLLAGLQASGMRVHLLAFGPGPLIAEAMARDISAAAGGAVSFKRPLSVAAAARACRQAIGRLHPDVVITSHVTAQYVARLASPGQWPAQVALLWDPPNPQRLPDRVSVVLPATRVAITAEVVQGYQDFRRGLPMAVITPGVDAAELRRASRTGSAEKVWAGAGLPFDAAPRLLMVGRLQRQKGALDLVSAMRLLAARHECRCLIVGPDEPLAPGHRAEIVEAIAAAGLEGRMAVSPRVAFADLAATMCDATLLVHPARSEPFGLVVVEALALGTPVVAYAATGPAEIISRGGGVTTPIGDIRALATAIESCLEPSTLRRLAAETTGIAEHYSADRSIEAFRAVVLRAIAAA